MMVLCENVLIKSSCSQIHNTGLFFPFHRFYVNAVESAMKEFCGYTGAFPYWDWSIGKRIAYVLTMHIAEEVMARCTRRGEQPSVSRGESSQWAGRMGRSFQRLPSPRRRLPPPRSRLSHPSHHPAKLHAATLPTVRRRTDVHESDAIRERELHAGESTRDGELDSGRFRGLPILHGAAPGESAEPWPSMVECC